MRLSELSLQKYGNFATLDLAFDPRPGRVEMLVAPNGAGKSVLRQAIGELLFGMHPQTPMGFRFGYDGMRIRAQAEAVDGNSFGFVRRKGRLNTLTDPAGAPADPRLLARLPHDRDRVRLERLFTLDSAQLEDGGKALLQSGGDLADALLSGAGELKPAREMVTRLRAQRDAVASMRKSARVPFHEAAEALKEAQQRLQAALVKPQQWAARQQQRDAATARRAEANGQAQQAAATVARLQRVRGTRRHLDALAEALAWLDAHPDAPELPPDLGPRLAAAQQRGAAAQTQHATLRQRSAELAAQCEALAIDEPSLAQADGIAALAEERGRARQSRNDIPLLAADIEAARAVIAALLRQLGSACDPADAAGEVRARADIDAARRLIVRHAGLAAAVADGPAAAARLQRGIADTQAALSALPPQAQTEAVEALVAEIAAGGAPETVAKRVRAGLADATENQRAALARVPNWHGDADALLALPTPAEAELNRLDQAVQAATQRLQQAARQCDRETAAVAKLQRLLAEQIAGERPPDRQAVLEARLNRDTGWRILRGRLDGKPADAAAEQRYQGEFGLVEVYEEWIRRADSFADRRAEESERLQRIVQLNDGVAEGERQAVGARGEHDEAGRAAAIAQAGWTEMGTRLGLPTGAGLAEARAFLAARSAVIDAAGALGRAAADSAELARLHEAWARRLAAELGAGTADGLDALLGAARLLTQRSLATEKQRASLRGALAAAQSNLRDHVATTQAAQGDLDAWNAAWQAILLRLRRDPAEHPDATGPVLDLLIRLEAEIGTAAGLQARVAKMQAQLHGFDRDTAALAERLGAAGGDSIAVVEAAMQRLQQAQAQKNKGDTLLEQAEAAVRAVQKAAGQEQVARQAVDEILRLAGAADVATAERRITLSGLRAGHAEAHRGALHRLREDGEGLGVAELQAQADAVPAELLAVQIAEAEAARAAAESTAQEAAAEEEGLKRDLQRLGEAVDVELAAADKSAAESRLSRVLEDALVHHTAAAMLEAALATVEATGDDPRLLRIGQAFAALTRGKYDRVSAGEIKGKAHPVLLAHEVAAPDELKEVDQLSEGTRDQLYLALRLVAIEDHVAGAPPLPFIADDILQTFDDERAVAALQALLRLSAHTQVIVLTHHDHLALLARSLPAGSVRVRRLDE